MKDQVRRLNQGQLAVLTSLLRKPLPARSVDHATWSVLSEMGLVSGPKSDGLLRITPAGIEHCSSYDAEQ